MALPVETDWLGFLQLEEERPTTAEARLQRLEDKDEIRQVLMLYAHLCDVRDWEGVLALMTDDIVRVLGGSLVERVNGKDELREKYERPTLRRASDGAVIPLGPSSSKIFHIMPQNVVKISADGKTAYSIQYYSLSTLNEEGERNAHEGTSVFTYVKEHGKWKIKKMVLMSEIAHDPHFKKQYQKAN